VQGQVQVKADQVVSQPSRCPVREEDMQHKRREETNAQITQHANDSDVFSEWAAVLNNRGPTN